MAHAAGACDGLELSGEKEAALCAGWQRSEGIELKSWEQRETWESFAPLPQRRRTFS